MGGTTSLTAFGTDRLSDKHAVGLKEEESGTQSRAVAQNSGTRITEWEKNHLRRHCYLGAGEEEPSGRKGEPQQW